MSICYKYIVKVGEKEIEIDDKVVKILNVYAKTDMSLEKLAEELGLESWEEAYEFVKKVPSWIIWTPSLLWKRELEKCSSAKDVKIVKL
ncbi:hypothetical protein Igag_1494 [Ignisphaera aggregans DSM 17230]|uniref:Uncharacterized protein n=1 Tax=Ignisphaera aggregans (strain DSM 17230 / JCM 13409 / AQ1.S1) TaxID=583356 RepID=E0SQW6_IGNAA|nr:hypothetical protein Igag_1494 [Ignisphaera aggregans DSM 17230]